MRPMADVARFPVGVCRYMELIITKKVDAAIIKVTDAITWAKTTHALFGNLRRMQQRGGLVASVELRRATEVEFDVARLLSWQRLLRRDVPTTELERWRFTGQEQPEFFDSLLYLFETMGEGLSSVSLNELYSQLRVGNALQYDVRIELMLEIEVKQQWRSFLTRKNSHLPEHRATAWFVRRT